METTDMRRNYLWTSLTASSYAASSFYVRNKWRYSRHMLLAGGQYMVVRGPVNRGSRLRAVRGGAPECGTGRYEGEKVNVYCIFFFIKFKHDSILRTILLMYNYSPVLGFFVQGRTHACMHAHTHTHTKYLMYLTLWVLSVCRRMNMFLLVFLVSLFVDAWTCSC